MKKMVRIGLETSSVMPRPESPDMPLIDVLWGEV